MGYAGAMVKKKNRIEDYLDELYAAGMAGNEAAQLEYIRFYVTETDAPLPDAAKQWLDELAEQGEDQARRCYFAWAMSGDAPEADWLKLEQWALAMVDYTPGEAYCMLGMLYEPGLPGFEDAKVAEAHYRKAVELGSASCGFYLARVLLKKRADNSAALDYAEIRRLLEAAVEVNPSVPAFDLLASVCSTLGDDAAAAKYLQKVHRLNPDDVECCLSLAYHYAEGGGVRQNDEIALRYFQKAANLGAVEGIYMVGLYTYKGVGTRRNVKRAVDYLQRAFDMGAMGAAYILGTCYYYGYAGRINIKTALDYWKQGADRYQADCCAALVTHYLDNAKGEVDIPKVQALLATAQEFLDPEDEITSQRIDHALQCLDEMLNGEM